MRNSIIPLGLRPSNTESWAAIVTVSPKDAGVGDTVSPSVGLYRFVNVTVMGVTLPVPSETLTTQVSIPGLVAR
nr:hypothetical protein [Leucobacter luti]